MAADAKGYLSLWRWAQELGEPAFAIEGTGSYGAGLARFLVAAGADVYECERPRRAERRRGKSDLIDATLAAGRLLADASLPRVRGVGCVRTCACCCSSGAARSEPAQLRSTSCKRWSSPLPRRCARGFRGLAGHQLAPAPPAYAGASGRAPSSQGCCDGSPAVSATSRSEIDELERELEAIVTRLVPELLAESGVGPVCAAQLVVSSGDPTRMASEASFAALAGTSPVQASSGLQQRHRLNRGGDRQLNRALHVIALNRIRWHPQTAAYHQKLLATGKTPREARRCVKRTLARYFHHRLHDDPRPGLTP